MLPHLNSLWVGKRLGYIEQLCFASAANWGHAITLYSYTPDELKGVPKFVELRDAREVMAEEKLVRYADTGAVALGANFFRYELLAKGLGYWIDADFYFLKPLSFNEEYVFGWEYEERINNAILGFPAESALVRDLCDFPRLNKKPPWFGPRRSLRYYWRTLRAGKRLGVEDLPWGTFSAGMLTYFAKKHRVADVAQKPAVFYPIRWKDARSVYGPPEVVESMLSPETRAVHLWHSRLSGMSDRVPPKGSYMDQICRRHDIDMEQAVALMTRCSET